MSELYLTTEGLESPLPESVNHYTKVRVVKGRFAQKYKTTKAKKFEKIFKEYLKEVVDTEEWSFNPDSAHHWYLDMNIYFDKLGSDSSNRDKQLLDAMNGIVFPDDKYVHPRVQSVYYDSKNPRIEMVLSPVEYTGIFKNDADKEQFIDTCKSCSRFLSGRCSILNDSLEGKVREEIELERELTQDNAVVHNNVTCTKYKKKKS